jgi:hypothetical protein
VIQVPSPTQVGLLEAEMRSNSLASNPLKQPSNRSPKTVATGCEPT